MFVISPVLAGESANKPGSRRFRVIELPLKPTHISNTGAVTGMAAGNRAAVWSQLRGLRRLPLASGFEESEATGSNRSGQVVGFMLSGDHAKSRAFAYENGRISLLPGEAARAQAVNDSGAIAGESRVKGKAPTTPVLWERRSVTDLGSCCGGVAKAVNNKGQVAGSIYDERGVYRAFVWDAGHGLQFLGETGSYSSAVGLNNLGHVLVQKFENGAFLYESEGKIIRLGAADGKPVDARAVNNADEVVGGSGPFSDASHAFLWSEKYGFRDLNEMIPAHSGWKLETAIGINDLGQIIGFGDRDGKEGRGFLLVEEDSNQPSGGMQPSRNEQ